MAMEAMLHLHAFLAAGVTRRHVHVLVRSPTLRLPHTLDLLPEPGPR